MIIVYTVTRRVKLIDTESKAVVPGGWEKEEDEKLLFSGHRVLVWESKKVLEMDSSHCWRTM